MSKKYDFQLVEKRNGWAAEIIRQITSRRTIVSKRQLGFTTEAEAKEWAEKELVEFQKIQTERNKRKSASKRKNEE
ncbi:DUF3622 domain-containing protein [Vibrio casei]|uniref:DUF3622 domain-containing protein n=1 Tax=Vibrio casei TaxID=673372 RepID=A0A368LPP2_9VIBR|nr:MULTISPECIES: DUF3622 domain-containing protein [Vibrio]RCS73781.1 DUF3622 domain-containing protein [Vibrio casei]SJN34926.1 Pressure-regulated ORF-like protein [Vibrio casei]HBV77324.1 DUF3622 domain-containing protein [Vibrio sp.]